MTFQELAKEYVRRQQPSFSVERAVREAQARKLILSLAEQTQSASELAACKRWLEGLS